jgi:hypothetical protein
MKVNRISEIIARSEDGEELRLSYSNKGEPYREGCNITLTLATDEYCPSVSMFLEHRELVQLRDSLNKILQK